MSNHKEKVFNFLTAENFPDKLKDSGCSPSEFNCFYAGHVAALCSTFNKIRYGHVKLVYGNKDGKDMQGSFQFEFMTNKDGLIGDVRGITRSNSTGVVKNDKHWFSNSYKFRDWFLAHNNELLAYVEPPNSTKTWSELDQWCITFEFQKRHLNKDMSLEEQMYNLIIFPHEKFVKFLDQLILNEELGNKQSINRKIKI